MLKAKARLDLPRHGAARPRASSGRRGGTTARRWSSWSASLMAMGFPTTLPVLGVMFLSTVGLRHLGLEVAGTRGSFVAAWAVLIVTGYLQWFVVVPRLVRWFREPGPRGAEAGCEPGATGGP